MAWHRTIRPSDTRGADRVLLRNPCQTARMLRQTGLPVCLYIQVNRRGKSFPIHNFPPGESGLYSSIARLHQLFPGVCPLQPQFPPGLPVVLFHPFANFFSSPVVIFRF